MQNTSNWSGGEHIRESNRLQKEGKISEAMEHEKEAGKKLSAATASGIQNIRMGDITPSMIEERARVADRDAAVDYANMVRAARGDR